MRPNNADIKTGAPSRQGFYNVELSDKTQLIAEWREYDKKVGKRWWQHVSEDPTIPKTPQPLDNVACWWPAEKERVRQFLERELTHEEKIAAAYERYCQSQTLYPVISYPVPDIRRLAIGDKVEVGLLEDATVVALHQNEEAVTVSYYRNDKKKSEVRDPVRCYGTWHWMDVLPIVKEPHSGLVTRSPSQMVTYLNGELRSLLFRMTHNGVTDKPEYQRQYAWSMDDKLRYLESLFEGRELGRFIFVRYGYPRGEELFDGKQRISVLMDLIASRLPYKGVYWHQLSVRDRNIIEGRSVQYATLNGSELSHADLLQIFLDVNAAGVPQTEEHLAAVRQMLAVARAKEAKAS